MFRVYLSGSPSVRPRAAPWWFVLALGVATALLLTFLFVVGAAIALFVAPVVLVLVLLGRWRLRRFIRDLGERQRPAEGFSSRESGRVIDADYRVVEDPDDR